MKRSITLAAALVLVAAVALAAGFTKHRVIHVAAGVADTVVACTRYDIGFSITAYDADISIKFIPLDAAAWTLEQDETFWSEYIHQGSVDSFGIYRAASTSARTKLILFQGY